MFRPVAITLVATLLNSITPLAQTKPTRAPSATAADEQQLKAIDDAWGEAESKRDEATLNSILDGRFILVDQSGKVTVGRTAFIEAGASRSRP
jgi:hypothetical protein